MAGSLDPMRNDVFNLRDVWVELYLEDANGDESTQLTEFWKYQTDGVLRDAGDVRRNHQCGAVGRRLTTVNHIYDLSLSRFQAHYTDDFDIITVSADGTYRIKLICTTMQTPDEGDPAATETRILKHCQLETRSINMEEVVNRVPTKWAVGEYTAPS